MGGDWVRETELCFSDTYTTLTEHKYKKIQYIYSHNTIYPKTHKNHTPYPHSYNTYKTHMQNKIYITTPRSLHNAYTTTHIQVFLVKYSHYRDH